MTIINLKGVIPDNVISQIDDNFIKKFNCNTELRLAHFLAQCSHESGGFKQVVENLNYGVKGLLATFPKYFNQVDVYNYEKRPELIGNKVYANRMGNGNEASGEGYKFRGRGYIQLTGKNNYFLFSKFIGEDCVAAPELVSTKYPLISAAYFFEKNSIWKVCDKGSTEAVVKEVTRMVNGGYIGLEHRLLEFNKIFSALKK